MKPIHLRTILVSGLLLFATAVVLAAADAAPTTGGAPSGWLTSNAATLWIPIVVPSLIAALKLVWPAIPRAWLPFLCPLIGAGLSLLGPILNQDIDPGLAAALGAVGNWLREAFDQSKQALQRSGAVGLAFAALMLAPNAQAQASDEVAGIWSRISVSPFSTYRVNDTARFNGKFGGGLAAGFDLNKHITLELETIAERFDDSHWGDSFTEAGANFKLYPFASGIIRPYALLGYTRNLDFDENRMNAGIGIEAPFGKSPISAFLDGRWTHDFDRVGHAMFRGGLNIRLGR